MGLPLIFYGLGLSLQSTRKAGRGGLAVCPGGRRNRYWRAARHIWHNREQKTIPESRTRAVQLGGQVCVSTAGIGSANRT